MSLVILSQTVSVTSGMSFKAKILTDFIRCLHRTPVLAGPSGKELVFLQLPCVVLALIKCVGQPVGKQRVFEKAALKQRAGCSLR